MASNDIGDWYRNIPQITKYWFTGSVLLPLLGKIGLVSAKTMVLNYGLVIYNFHIWRPITAVFYYPISPQTGFHYLVNLYFLYSYSTRIETGLFDGKPADYAFMLIFNWLCILIIAFVVYMKLLMDPLVLSVVYIWCQLNKDQMVSFWFGTRFKAMYLPWVLVAFNIIIRGGGMNELIGIVVGHMYFFLMFKYPQDFGGRMLLSTPKFLYRYFPNRTGGISGFGQAPVATARRREEEPEDNGGGEQRHAWGQGNVLGD